MKRGIFASYKPWEQILVLMVLIMSGMFLTRTFSELLLQYFQVDNFDFHNYGDQQTLRLSKIMIIGSQIIELIIPCWAFIYLVSEKPLRYLYVRRVKKHFWFWLLPLLIFMVYLNMLLTYVNHQIDFSFISDSFQNEQLYNKALIGKRLHAYIGPSAISFVFNFFLMVLLPAIVEEILYRGILQRVFAKHFRNFHVGIILSSAVFASMHQQTFNWIPIFVMGLCFGYLLLAFQSIWVPILLHFLNNLIYLISSQYSAVTGKELDFSLPVLWLSIIVAVLGLFIFLNFRRMFKSKLQDLGAQYLA